MAAGGIAGSAATAGVTSVGSVLVSAGFGGSTAFGGGAFGFASLVGFAHAYETLLDYVRDGRIESVGAAAFAALLARERQIVGRPLALHARATAQAIRQ